MAIAVYRGTVADPRPPSWFNYPGNWTRQTAWWTLNCDPIRYSQSCTVLCESIDLFHRRVIQSYSVGQKAISVEISAYLVIQSWSQFCRGTTQLWHDIQQVIRSPPTSWPYQGGCIRACQTNSPYHGGIIRACTTDWPYQASIKLILSSVRELK